MAHPTCGTTRHLMGSCHCSCGTRQTQAQHTRQTRATLLLTRSECAALALRAELQVDAAPQGQTPLYGGVCPLPHAVRPPLRPVGALAALAEQR